MILVTQDRKGVYNMDYITSIFVCGTLLKITIIDEQDLCTLGKYESEEQAEYALQLILSAIGNKKEVIKTPSIAIFQ